ncbi:hypothetical protein [Tychonema sp. LEGE 07203]|uniref:hypothetical protein n=1 Tax=Tychonema sp. LEGE 07203 TaxID=1828671 RepID=UPI0018830D6D|nr:hypothetical protein [Tychonema sp. LEGE 07203]MBE9094680.1 hypothetical protein [Tychonema sp. LEGE 07203]
MIFLYLPENNIFRSVVRSRSQVSRSLARYNSAAIGFDITDGWGLMTFAIRGRSHF